MENPYEIIRDERHLDLVAYIQNAESSELTGEISHFKELEQGNGRQEEQICKIILPKDYREMEYFSLNGSLQDERIYLIHLHYDDVDKYKVVELKLE